MKKLIVLLLLSCCGLSALANHITGGMIYYRLESQNGNNFTYVITLRLYRDNNPSTPNVGAPLDASAPISIFNARTFTSAFATIVPRKEVQNLILQRPDPCINNPPVINYEVGIYEFTVTLPGIPDGYIVAYQRCCRINGINNLLGSSGVGATYTAQIPGTLVEETGPANTSAFFTGIDTVVVCADNFFTYDFGAQDADGDSLSYFFCNAFTGGTSGNPAPNPPAAPNYASVPYASPFSASQPMGSDVTLNSNTGLVSGVAPPPGIYVVTVCVNEYREGKLIATQRKDLQIKVGDCDLVRAILPSSYPLCDDFTRTFENLSPPNPLITTYDWSFGDNNSSTQTTPTHTFADTGSYLITLVVNRGQPCSDSATTRANVYPGFFPGFTMNGVCATKPSQFFDTTRTVYGFVNSWRWDFGDPSTISDTSRLQNPAYTYPTNGTRNVRFIVTSNKGCIDTVFRNVAIVDRPPLQALPKDTLICNGDNVQLQAIGVGHFSWTGPNITNANTATPTVSPTATSNYIVQLDDNGCLNTDTVRVRVVNFVTLAAMPDTVICATDSVQLRAATDGLRFEWTPAATINDPSAQNPRALPTATTTYQVRAIIGGCEATDDIRVTLVPYPGANAGRDTIICFDGSAQLNANIAGSAFTWSPTSTLSNPSILNPVARPRNTTRYVLTVTDVLGCPKPGRDTVLVTVRPRVNAFAGRDTAVVVGQPLQFEATGGVNYVWTPTTALSNPLIADPVAQYDGSFDSIRYSVTVFDENGCFDSAAMKVRIFNTAPQIFVPTAFTPNGDGKNDRFQAIAVGISRFEYFRVFNRWGQLVFETSNPETSWDGKIKGLEQGTNTFVWVVKGIDYTGKEVFAKGTVTLIR